MTKPISRDPLTLGYAGIAATDPGAWERLCRDVLGMEIAAASPAGRARFKMDQRVYRLAVEPSDHDGLAFAGWEARDVTAIDRIAKAVESFGIAVTEADGILLDERSVSRLISFTDPAGIACEVFTGIKVEEEKPFMSQLGVSFVTGQQGLGHLNLLVDNYEATFDFYVNVLGFGISDYRPASRGTAIAFLGCDPRHHSLGLIDSGNHGTFLDHVMVEVADFADVGRAYDKVFDGAAQLSLTMGKHWNDQMTSFYLESPSGFDIEYGWGGRLIDRDSWVTVQFNSAAIWGHRAASEKAAGRMGTKTWIEMENIAGLGLE